MRHHLRTVCQTLKTICNLISRAHHTNYNKSKFKISNWFLRCVRNDFFHLKIYLNFLLDECSNNQQGMVPARRFDTVMENAPSDSLQDGESPPQMHEQLTVHSRHHSPFVADLTNGQLFMSGPNDFRQK